MAWATTGSNSFLVSLRSERTEGVLLCCGLRRFKGHCEQSPVSLESLCQHPSRDIIKREWHLPSGCGSWPQLALRPSYLHMQMPQ